MPRPAGAPSGGGPMEEIREASMPPPLPKPSARGLERTPSLMRCDGFIKKPEGE